MGLTSIFFGVPHHAAARLTLPCPAVTLGFEQAFNGCESSRECGDNLLSVYIAAFTIERNIGRDLWLSQPKPIRHWAARSSRHPRLTRPMPDDHAGNQSPRPMLAQFITEIPTGSWPGISGREVRDKTTRTPSVALVSAGLMSRFVAP